MNEWLNGIFGLLITRTVSLTWCFALQSFKFWQLGLLRHPRPSSDVLSANIRLVVKGESGLRSDSVHHVCQYTPAIPSLACRCSETDKCRDRQGHLPMQGVHILSCLMPYAFCPHCSRGISFTLCEVTHVSASFHFHHFHRGRGTLTRNTQGDI